MWRKQFLVAVVPFPGTMVRREVFGNAGLHGRPWAPGELATAQNFANGNLSNLLLWLAQE